MKDRKKCIELFITFPLSYGAAILHQLGMLSIASTIKFRTRIEYIYYYKRRWQIETNYWAEDEVKINSKSTNCLVRYFYFLVSLLIHLFWIVNKNLDYMLLSRDI